MNSMLRGLGKRFVCVKVEGDNKKPYLPGQTTWDIPSLWMTYDAALASGSPHIGLVIDDHHPEFLLDLDTCRDRTTGIPTPEAARILSMFPGAYMEVSSSGEGFHVVGRCDKGRVSGITHKNREWSTPGGQPCEFYTGRRVMTVGGGAWQGDVATDHTDALLALVPPRDAPKGSAPAFPVRPPTGIPDPVVIARILAAPDRRARASFGTAATFADLWQADPLALARFFPPVKPGKPINHSGADLAFMNAIVYWCGGDPIQMDRIYRSSALFRMRGDGGAKWNRADYRNETLGKALAGRTEFHDWHAQPATGVDGNLGEYLTITDQQEHFAGCVYVVEPHRILTPDHGLLAPEQFNAVYGGHRFVISTGENAGTTKKAFEAFTENRGVRFPKAKRTGILPDRPFGEIVGDTVNVYRAPPAPTPGDVTPFLVHLAKLIPDAGDRHSLLLWLGHVVQRPGKLTRWAPVLVGAEGNGKGFLAECVARAIGLDYRHVVKPKELLSDFNGWAHGKLFAQVDEIDLRERREVLDTLKPMITDPAINVRAMRTDSVNVVNAINWWFNTNHIGAIPKSADDRRYAVFHTGQQSKADKIRDGLTGAYFRDLYAWASAGGYEHVAAYLATIDLAAFPLTAPDTSTTADAIEAGRGPLEQAILEAVDEERPGFRGGWISSAALTRLWTERGGRHPGPRAVSAALAALGYRCAGKASRVVMMDGGSGRPILHRKGLDESAERGACVDPTEYEAAQGMSARPPVSANPPVVLPFPRVN